MLARVSHTKPTQHGSEVLSEDRLRLACRKVFAVHISAGHLDDEARQLFDHDLEALVRVHAEERREGRLKHLWHFCSDERPRIRAAERKVVRTQAPSLQGRQHVPVGTVINQLADLLVRLPR